MVASCAAQPMGLVSHFAQRGHRDVARALHDPGNLALSGLPGVILGPLPAQFLGLVHLFRNARPVPRAVPAGDPALPGDLHLRDQGGAAPRAGGSACLNESSPTACWPSSTARKRWWTPPSAPARKAIVTS